MTKLKQRKKKDIIKINRLMNMLPKSKTSPKRKPNNDEPTIHQRRQHNIALYYSLPSRN